MNFNSNYIVMDNGDKPAYPMSIHESQLSTSGLTSGLTKREEFAKAAMQGMLSGPLVDGNTGACSYGVDDVVEWSVNYADALLKRLEQ